MASTISKGILKTNVDIVKYDGTNKEEIITLLNIDSFIERYFKKTGVYFIIPDNKDWFILDEEQYKKMIIL